MPCICCFHSEINSQMGFTHTWWSPLDHVLAALHERQPGQFPNNLTIDTRLEAEVELLQRFDPGQASLLFLSYLIDLLNKM